MHQHSNTEDEYQIVDHIYVVDLHLVEKLAGLLVVTIKFVAQQVLPIGSVYGVQQAVETRTEIWYIEHPAKQTRRVKVTYAEAEDGEQHRDYRTKENCELQGIMKLNFFLLAYA